VIAAELCPEHHHCGMQIWAFTNEGHGLYIRSEPWRYNYLNRLQWKKFRKDWRYQRGNQEP